MKIARRERHPAGPANPTTTVPAGAASVPPPGPATPVTDRAQCDPVRSRAPHAIASATGSLTAVCSRSTSSGTPSSVVFIRFVYVEKAAREVIGTARHRRNPPCQQPPGAALGHAERLRPRAQGIAHHQFEGVQVLRIDPVAQNRLDLRTHLGKQSLGLGFGIAARAEVHLNISRRGQNGSHRVGVLRVNGRDPLVHLGLGMSAMR